MVRATLTLTPNAATSAAIGVSFAIRIWVIDPPFAYF
jgi:hypothetical protein